MKQDDFNKFYTIFLTVFFMVMYIWSFVTGKHVDVETILTLAVPMISHVLHLTTRTTIITKVNGNAVKEGKITESHS